MSGYKELMDQARALVAQAEEMQRTERAQAIREIKATMLTYGIEPRDLGKVASGPVTRESNPPRYRSPDGKEWSGFGRKPFWVVDALAAGKSLSDFAIPQISM